MTSSGDDDAGNLSAGKGTRIPGRIIQRYIDDGFVLRLIDVSGDLENDWRVLKDGEEIPVFSMKGEDLLDAALEQVSCISIGGKDSSELLYQSFPRWDEKAFADLERKDVSIGTVPEGSGQRLRITSGGSRYEMICQARLMRDPSPSYILSRLNAKNFGYSVDLLGMSYWKFDGRNIPWLMMIRYPEGTSSGFSPFLSDLNKLISSSIRLHSDELKGFLLDLTRSDDRASYGLSRRIGRAIGELHGCLIMDHGKREFGDSEGDRILRLFTKEQLGMEDIGSSLGRVSGYIEELKVGLMKEIGTVTHTVAPGRKQRVVRALPQKDPYKGLSLLRGSLSQKHKVLRERFSLLRKFKGSPLVPSGLDCSLENIELQDDLKPIFRKFDWTFHSREGPRVTKVLPLKDLALVLNSLKKARFLSSARVMERISRGRDMGMLDILFLEYNLAKESSTSMMRDLNAFLMVRKRDIPFRYVFLTSIVSSIWYEKNRNSLVLGYNEGLSGTENEDLLVYPKGIDTLEGIKMMQIIASLSSASRTLRDGMKSKVGLESDLLTALTV